jgi:hypothetical protein
MPSILHGGKDLFAGQLYQNAALLYYTDDRGNAAPRTYGAGGEALCTRVRIRRQPHFFKDHGWWHIHDLREHAEGFICAHLERANSNQDVRHRVVADFSPEAPERSPLRNFELTGIVTLQSARPFTLFVGYDANGDIVL